MAANNSSIIHLMNPIASVGDGSVVSDQQQRLVALAHEVL